MTNSPTKSNLKINLEILDFCVFSVKAPVIYLEITCYRCFCNEDKFVFLKSKYNAASFDTLKAHYSKKEEISDP
jgi:hypothetical protein